MSLNGIKITEVDGKEVIQIEEFTDIYDTRELTQSFLKDLKRSFHNKGKYKDIFSQKQEFAGKNIYHYENDIKMFEYDSIDDLQVDLNAWKEKFKKKNDLVAEKVDDRQILEVSGYFEYEGKFYLLGLLYADENKEDNDEVKGVLNGVIINHNLYFGISDETQEEIDTTLGKVDDIYSL